MIVFLALGITLLSSAFSLGGVSYLYLRYRTKVLRMVILFLLSLFLIAMGFFVLDQLESGIASFLWLFHLVGIGLNIFILPFLVSALLSVPIRRIPKLLLYGWDSLFVVLVIAVFIFPDISAIPYILTVMEIATIIGSLIFLITGLRSFKNRFWKRVFFIFFAISAVFVVLLVLDILISTVPIRSLAFFDNLSLPFYLMVLNAGTFYFAGKFLSRDALVRNGQITESCLSYYGLTKREGEIIGELLKGKNNKEIAEKHYISVKTVENHLYNIYQKTDVGSRTQLLHQLQSWSRE